MQCAACSVFQQPVECDWVASHRLRGFGSRYLTFLEKSMRKPTSVLAAGRKILGLLLVAGSIFLVSGQRSFNFSPREKAAYAPAAAVQFVNPGLNFSIVSA